jgi:hypothetical protein
MCFLSFTQHSQVLLKEQKFVGAEHKFLQVFKIEN